MIVIIVKVITSRPQQKKEIAAEDYYQKTVSWRSLRVATIQSVSGNLVEIIPTDSFLLFKIKKPREVCGIKATCGCLIKVTPAWVNQANATVFGDSLWTLVTSLYAAVSSLHSTVFSLQSIRNIRDNSSKLAKCAVVSFSPWKLSLPPWLFLFLSPREGGHPLLFGAATQTGQN